MRRSIAFTHPKTKAIHPHAWLWENLESEHSFLLRPMFGLKALYMDGTLMLCFAAKTEPWRGLLIATDRERQTALIAEFPILSPHPILPKWLYLAEASENFETAAVQLVSLVRQRDSRIGVIPKIKKAKKKSSLG